MANVNGQKANAAAIVVLCVAILLIVGALGWVIVSSKTTELANANACSNLGLSQGGASGAAGTIYKYAVITNNGDTDCTLTGFPAVFMQDSSGMQVGTGAEANSLYSPQSVTIAAGQQAHTVVAFPQYGNFPEGSCSGLGSSMKIYLPGVADPLTTDWPDYRCPGFSATAIMPGAEE
ncbi:MAG: DUF4232 domain-containing protein [Candidatus Woesebacteria bacterium]|jgi:hypothetical protein